MKNILYHLYHGEINERERSTKELQKTEEWQERDEAYEKLEKTLSKEQETLFEEYYMASSGYFGLEKERAYANGVRTGMLLTLEMLKFEP